MNGKTDEEYLVDDIREALEDITSLRKLAVDILSVYHPTADHLFDALVSLRIAARESEGVMDCGVSDIPTTAGCSFCGKSGHWANSECGCKCHPKE